jgi:glycine/D-amino acid oxidase-like deaminating enzyme
MRLASRVPARAVGTFDLAIVGAGIVGTCVAYQATQAHPAWRVLLIDRSLIGSGATRYSLGFDFPFGRTPAQRRFSRESSQLYSALREAIPHLPFRKLPVFCIVSHTQQAVLSEKFTGAKPKAIEGSERRNLDDAFPGLRLGDDQLILGGISGAYSFPSQIAQELARRFAAGEQTECWEGVEVDNTQQRGREVHLHTADGREVVARGVILATGPWALTGPGKELVRSAGIRIKKVVALHVERCPTPQDPVLFFLDEDAYLMPVVEHRQWWFSITCMVWDCEPEASRLKISEADRQLGLAILDRYCPSFVNDCTNGRLFCDAYGPDWTPVVAADTSAPNIVFAGAGSGSGYRLAPAIAHHALARLERVLQGSETSLS